LLIPYGGYFVVAGNSMDPAINKGCNIIQANQWDNESPLIGEVVVYQTEYQEQTFSVTNEHEINHSPLFVHRVVAEYKEYDMSNAKYYINEHDVLIKESNQNIIEFDTKIYTDQSYESAKKLEGEHVIILKGDNNPHIDTEIVPVDNVKGILNENNYYQLQSLKSWPCEVTNQ